MNLSAPVNQAEDSILIPCHTLSSLDEHVARLGAADVSGAAECWTQVHAQRFGDLVIYEVTASDTWTPSMAANCNRLVALYSNGQEARLSVDAPRGWSVVNA